MTKKELVERLSQYADDAVVYMDINGPGTAGFYVSPLAGITPGVDKTKSTIVLLYAE